MLHLKYKLPLCKPEIEFKKQTGAKALATDHHDPPFTTVVTQQAQKQRKGEGAPAIRAGVFVFCPPLIFSTNPITSTVNT